MALKDTYVTISEAAEELGVARQTISRWVRRGLLDSEQIGRETLIKKEDLGKFKLTKVAKTFDEAIISAFIHEIRQRYQLSSRDKIQHLGNLQFDIRKADGSRQVAYITMVSIEPKKIELKPYDEFIKKQDVSKKPRRKK